MELIIELLTEYTGVTADAFNRVFSFIGLVGSILVALISPIIASRYYFIKRFPDQITFSGNFFEASSDKVIKLKIRNPLMLPMDDVLPTNALFRLKLFWAMSQCSAEDSFIRMSASDMDVLQPSIINALSAEYSEGITAKMLGLSVEEEQLYIAVTFEKDGEMKNQKIRVMFISEKELKNLADKDFVKKVGFERSHHRYRMYTLGCMLKQLQKEEYLSNDEMRVIRPVSVYFRK